MISAKARPRAPTRSHAAGAAHLQQHCSISRRPAHRFNFVIGGTLRKGVDKQTHVGLRGDCGRQARDCQSCSVSPRRANRDIPSPGRHSGDGAQRTRRNGTASSTGSRSRSARLRSCRCESVSLRIRTGCRQQGSASAASPACSRVNRSPSRRRVTAGRPAEP